MAAHPPPLQAPSASIRSFSPRGRLTESQRRALDSLWPRYGVEGPVDLDALFGRRAKRHLEIGFGRGEALLAMARAHPENDYLGVDVYSPGAGHLLRQLHEQGIGNVRVLLMDAVEVLAWLPEASLAGVYLFFPDPWPKRRHHKRRLVQPPFVEQVASRLEPSGRFLLATDWKDYAHHMLAVMEASPHFRNLAGKGFARRPALRPLTRFERRGRALGHEVWDLAYERL
ncbi:MAG: tRNA (guanosine(46)-N7)-methyltransferase TrmB [Gammaproteobacteria bacterium]|nr:MAG: tRNA (guanosine(46)-N7)-methyltransferase TrmB [Gammaproteobacteria bacterium]